MVRTKLYTDANFDTKPSGFNAVLAVIAHSGFDMEDAVVINKHSYQRGFGHASVYKTTVIDAMEGRKHAVLVHCTLMTNKKLRER